MKLTSFMRSGFTLLPVEVEISLLPGLPQIVFLGLPDTMIRESVGRIKSALKHQGFEFPQARQVLVQLRPAHLRKSSHGLDLAVAAGILWETGQLKKPEGVPVVYGELSLKGEVICPDDIADLPNDSSSPPVLTGKGGAFDFPTLQATTLRELLNADRVHASLISSGWQRPECPDLLLSRESAELLAIAASGEHSVLIAGPPGTGKTTAAEAIHHVLLPIPTEVSRVAQRYSRIQGDDLKWRPLVQPHHSITSLAMIGGGAPPLPGEITRAHGGLLVMDEFLEFQPVVQEALREPMEKGEVRIARGSSRRSFPAQFLLIATTNLCPCGQFLPNRDELCRCPRGRRMAYLTRLRGPFIDRFTMTMFTHTWSKQLEIPLLEVRERIDRATTFRIVTRGQSYLNSKLREDEVINSLTTFQRKQILPQAEMSKRRLLSMVRVARTLADLDLSIKIENKHIDRAAELCVENFQALARASAQ